MSIDPKQIESDFCAWDGIEDHRTGSPGDLATDDWLAGQIHAAGATAEMSRFQFQRRDPGIARVTSDDNTVNGLPCFDGPSRDATPIQGSAGALGSDAAIGVCQFSPGGSAELENARHNHHHQAIIAVCAGADIVPGLAVQNAERFLTPFGPPVLQVPSHATDWLLEVAKSGRALELQAELTVASASAANVQTTVAGSEPELPPLVIMTPKSAWWTCTAERGGGICAWLACLRHFASTKPARTVIFTANTGHDTCCSTTTGS